MIGLPVPSRSLLLGLLLLTLVAGCGASPTPTDSDEGSAAFVPADGPMARDTTANGVVPGGSAVASLEHEIDGGKREDDRDVLLEFHAHHALHPFDFLGTIPLANESPQPIANPDGDGDGNDGGGDDGGANDDEANPGDDPPVVRIDDRVLHARAFADRAFRMHHSWYLDFLRELMVDRVARLEAKREGITFDPDEVARAHQNVVDLARQRARRLRRSWREHWQSLGYDTEQSYLAAVGVQVERVLLLERLVLLMDMRLTKVGFSWIVIRDRADRLTPNPKAKAEKISEELRTGKMDFQTAVRRFSTESNSRAKGGQYGVIVRGTLGVEELEQWLFANPPGSISKPILHPVYGWVIARVDAVAAGEPSLTWAAAAERLLQRLAEQQGLPGTRVTGRDTFIWLERIMATNRYEIRSFAPLAGDDSPWVATVDGKPITAGDMVRHAFRHNPDWARLIMTEVIVFAVAESEATREGMTVSDEQVADAATKLATYLRQSARDNGRNFDQVWQGQGYESFDAFVHSVIRPFARQSLLMEWLVCLHDLRQERRAVWHILCQSEALAKQARTALLQGATFENAAKAFSQHAASRQRGGLLGEEITRDMFGDEFGNVAFRLSTGSISDPVQTEQGWHIIRVTRIAHARPNLAWPAARDEVTAMLGRRGDVPGQRITAADMSRWIEAIHATKRYDIQKLID